MSPSKIITPVPEIGKQQENVSLTRYFVAFVLFHVGGVIIISLLSYMFDFTPRAGTWLTIGCAIGTSGFFVSEQKRAPNPQENKRLIWGSIALSYAIAAVFIMSLYFFMSGDEETKALLTMLSELSVMIWTITLLVSTAVFFLLFTISYGWFARSLMEDDKDKKVEKKGK